jgi:hypothetical protein
MSSPKDTDNNIPLFPGLSKSVETNLSQENPTTPPKTEEKSKSVASSPESVILVEPTAREKRKIAMAEEAFRRIEKAEKTGPKKRTSDEPEFDGPTTMTEDEYQKMVLEGRKNNGGEDYSGLFNENITEEEYQKQETQRRRKTRIPGSSSSKMTAQSSAQTHNMTSGSKSAPMATAHGDFSTPPRFNSDQLLSTRSSLMGRQDLPHKVSFQFSTSNESPSSISNLRNPGAFKHREWSPISVHTAKCDRCSNHNTSVIQRCKSCNFQICKTCIGDSYDDSNHEVANPQALDWTPDPTQRPFKDRAPRAQNGSGASRGRGRGRATRASNRSSLNDVFTLPSGSRSRVTKTVTTRLSAKASSERLKTEAEKRGFPEDDNSNNSMFVSGPESACMSSARKSMDEEYELGSTTEEDPMNEDEVRAEYEKRRPKKPKNLQQAVRADPSSYYGSLEGGSFSGGSLGNSRGRADRVKASMTASSSSGPAHGPPPNYSPQPRPSSHYDQDDWKDVIAEAAQKAEKEKKAAKERAFEFECKAAWDHDPTFVQLRSEGKTEEAEAAFEVAVNLMRIKRGL